VPRRLMREERLKEQRAQNPPDDRPDDRHPPVTPIRVALAGDGKNRVRDSPSKVTGGIDRIPGRATERQPDPPDEQANQERRERAAERRAQRRSRKLAVFSTGPAIRNTGANVLTEAIGTFTLVFGVLAIVANFGPKVTSRHDLDALVDLVRAAGARLRHGVQGA
jgi:hypothetical protein